MGRRLLVMKKLKSLMGAITRGGDAHLMVDDDNISGMIK